MPSSVLFLHKLSLGHQNWTLAIGLRDLLAVGPVLKNSSVYPDIWVSHGSPTPVSWVKVLCSFDPFIHRISPIHRRCCSVHYIKSLMHLIQQLRGTLCVRMNHHGSWQNTCIWWLGNENKLVKLSNITKRPLSQPPHMEKVVFKASFWLVHKPSPFRSVNYFQLIDF